MGKILFAMLAACVGCVSTGQWDYLSQPDRDRFGRCYHHLSTAQCGTDQSILYTGICLRDLQAQYANAQNGKRWLIENGCPVSMVNPDAYTSITSDERKSSRKTSEEPAPKPSALPSEPPASGQAADDESPKSH